MMAPLQMAIDPKSFASYCLVPYAFSQEVAQGTGFVVKVDQHHLLLTNYHVLSGRHPDTQEPFTHVPDRVLIPLLRNYGDRYSWHAHVQLVDFEGSKLWIEHPRYGSSFDVVAFPLSIPKNTHVVSYDFEPGPSLAVRPSSDVSIIGFPEGMSAAGLTAIWKSGTIASEFDLTLESNQFFWIDSNARPGMSGSPVIARRFGGALMADGNYSLGTQVVDRTLGVYAGRALDAPDMTLGRVWGWDGVQEVVRSAVDLLNRNAVKPVVARIGHYERPGRIMYELDGKKSAQFRALGPSGEMVRTVTLRDVFDDIILTDLRFGKTLTLVKMSVAIAAAVENGVSKGEPVRLDEEQYALVKEVLENPTLGYNPAWARQVMPLIEHILNAPKRQ